MRLSKPSKIVIGVAVLVYLACSTALLHVNIRDITEVQKENFYLQAQVASLTGKVAKLQAVVAELAQHSRRYPAVASWYGPGFHGRTAADGSRYDQYAFTVAHKTLPFGTIIIVEYEGRRVPALVTDRGPFIDGRDFDLSYGVALRLGVVKAGVVEVTVTEVEP